jgi:hypothetical protein
VEINIDLETEIAKAVTAAIDPARIGDVIRKQVEKTVDDAVNNAFGWSGDFSKTVRAAVSTLVPHSLELSEQANWNHFVTHAINERLTAFNDERLTQVLAPTLDKLLVKPPESIKLSDLLKSIVSHWRRNDDFQGDPWMDIEISSGILLGHKDIYISKHRPSTKYASEIRLRISDDVVWGLKMDDKDVEKTKFAGPYFNLERQLFQLYACKTKIEFDVEDISDVDFDDCGSDEDDD